MEEKMKSYRFQGDEEKRDEIRFICNNQGQEIAVDLLDPHLVRRHDMVEDVFDEIEAFERMLVEKKELIASKIYSYLTSIERKAKVEQINSNMTLTNYSQTKQIQIKRSEIVSFDERLQLAKEKTDRFIRELSEKAGDTEESRIISHIAQSAFQVGKKGEVNKSKIIELSKINIKNKEWISIQKLIRDSLQIDKTKQYMNFSRKMTPEGKWENVDLNFKFISGVRSFHEGRKNR